MKVGDYIRTDDGLIGKVVSEPYEYKDSIGCDIDFGNNDVFNEYEMWQRIIKSSPNIIDLIEVGDYVNGKHVDKYQGKLGVFCELPNGKWEFIELTNEHYLISSIVTKEQFSCMEYKIGE